MRSTAMTARLGRSAHQIVGTSPIRGGQECPRSFALERLVTPNDAARGPYFDRHLRLHLQRHHITSGIASVEDAVR